MALGASEALSSGTGASVCTLCEVGSYTAKSGQATCVLSSGGSSVPMAGATAQTACPAGRFSGAGASLCLLCPSGTMNAAGEATCTTVDAGFIAPPPMVFQMTLRSAIFLEPIDAAAFDGDIAAKNQLKAALTAVLVTDTFSRRVEEGSEITSVGPATLIPLSNLGFDQGSAASIALGMPLSLSPSLANI